MRQLHCQVLDVSDKAIEETASRIMSIVQKNKELYGEGTRKTTKAHQPIRAGWAFVVGFRVSPWGVPLLDGKASL